MLDTFVVLFWYLIVSLWFHKVAGTCLKGFYGVKSNSTWPAEVFTWSKASMLSVFVSHCLGYVLWGRAPTSCSVLGFTSGAGVHINSAVVPPAPWDRQEGGWTAEAGGQWPRRWPGAKLYSWGSLAAANPSQHKARAQGRAAFLSVTAKLCPGLQKRAAATWHGLQLLRKGICTNENTTTGAFFQSLLTLFRPSIAHEFRCLLEAARFYLN